MNNFLTKYEKILEILKQFETKSNFLNQIRCPRLSDIELIALDITAESLSIDSESYFLSQIALIYREFSRTLLGSCSWYLYDW